MLRSSEKNNDTCNQIMSIYVLYKLTLNVQEIYEWRNRGIGTVCISNVFWHFASFVGQTWTTESIGISDNEKKFGGFE